MNKFIITLSGILLYTSFSFGQHKFEGYVTDQKSEPLVGVNVFLKNTWDGATTDSIGHFIFESNSDQYTLIVKYIGYEEIEKKIDLTNLSGLNFSLKEKMSELNTVTINAGYFEASDEKKSTILRPLDIVRTAGSNGDIFGALQTLPGAQRVGESEGMFVRGGSSAESRTLIDGMLVQNPFFSSLPDLSTRSRFSPFLFKGTAFSTGGYSAQYGQALSSIVNLESEDLAPSSSINVFISPITGSIASTKRWDNASLAVSGNYTNTNIANQVIPQNVNWIKPVTGFGNSVIFRHQFKKNHLIKAFTNYGHSDLGMYYRDFSNSMNTFTLQNDNFFQNFMYRANLKNWTLSNSMSYSYNQDNIAVNQDNIRRVDERVQLRSTARRDLFKNSSILFGLEAHHYQYISSFNQFSSKFEEDYFAQFIELELYLSPKIATRIGVRSEYSKYLNKTNLAPRLSLAYKLTENSQISLAFGQFFQNPENKYLFKSSNLGFEQAIHSIINYQWMKDGYTFRIEGYYKKYDQLVRELDTQIYDPNPNRLVSSNLNNTGYGYAAGFDLFFRDKEKTFKNIDYWVSYSFIDTERFSQNFISVAVPAFVSKHNFSFVYKQYIPKLRLDLNLTYSYASGRGYYNPNNAGFLQDLTPDYHNLNLGINYITQLWGSTTIVIFSVNNLLANKQVFGYRYSSDGSTRAAVLPAANIGFFLGLSMTIK